MKTSTPQNIAIIIGLFISIITLGLSLWAKNIGSSDYFLFLLLEVLAVFILTFIFSYLLIRNLLINKIRPIYKIINASKEKEPDFDNRIKEHDIISEVEEKVAIWARKKSKEIDELKKLEKYRKEFLGNVSHELKTPIFNIQGYVLTLLDGGLEDESINTKYLERTEKNVNRLISIIKDLETISKLEAGELELKFENFNIIDLVREVFDFQETNAKQKNIKLQIIGSEKNIIVNADRKQLFDLISNLVINSINYGKLDGCTTIGFFDLESKVLIEISDNGIGINEKNLPRIFERFYRVDKGRSRNDGGTGLGLAIVKHIIEAHSEKITASSKFGEGASFRFTLKKTKK